jgi:hypothetical protein
MDINLHIERLVLEGVDTATGQSDLLQASVVNELTQLLNRGGLASNFNSGASLDQITTKDIQLTDGKPQAFGQQIAKVLHRGLSQ